MSAQIVIAKDKPIARFIPALLRVEGRSKAGAAQNLEITGILDHLGADTTREDGNGVIQHAIGIKDFAVGSAAGEPLVVVIGIHVSGQQELAHVVDTARALGALFGSRQSWQQHCR